MCHTQSSVKTKHDHDTQTYCKIKSPSQAELITSRNKRSAFVLFLDQLAHFKTKKKHEQTKRSKACQLAQEILRFKMHAKWLPVDKNAHRIPPLNTVYQSSMQATEIPFILNWLHLVRDFCILPASTEESGKISLNEDRNLWEFEENKIQLKWIDCPRTLLIYNNYLSHHWTECKLAYFIFRRTSPLFL